ncbi:6-phosphogluconate dehydrogenase, putative [Babesia bigemina]|uniref:6-phosphogluconate dehydrogenase, decarboxylating n=1 Tax=Babesia bigemina TaxID=5866 RepID=A0A061D5X3_BABBI|nr:6-phosphogluconate dehydrogenase, putative [Babesia bigemina]CDR95963.1 6-phosphogluconate dehydrogenase, putative [Babesia bigemina]|eukprot:XP_012768149.1 6-phosphogluconate dehydrogenase, putative [Babesia bigemina]
MGKPSFEMTSEFGVIGLGVMGSAYTQNLASRGIPVAAWSIQQHETQKMMEQNIPNLQLFSSLPDFVKSLKRPRKIIMLITAGKAVDQTIDSLIGLLREGDILLDGGNEWYENTVRRLARCAERGIHYCGVGISGGERGARESPCMMFGGQPEDYEAVRPFIEQEPGRSFYVGPGASGHYVKMVHNGIEYAIMQVLSEVYMIMRDIFELQLDSIHQILAEWDQGDVGSFLLGITANILQVKASDGVTYLVDKIVDSSGANGTGKWTVKEALDLGVPVPTITTAVEMRHASNSFRSTVVMSNKKIKEGHSISEGDLRRTLFGCIIVCFAQGISLLMKASENFGWGLDMGKICRIWSSEFAIITPLTRAEDAIISCKLLEPISEAFEENETLANLLEHPDIRAKIGDSVESWRKVCKACLNYNLSAPAIIASLQYIQTMSSMNLGHNLIQAQRDYFGAHCFTRNDGPGKHHYNWVQ